MTRNEIDLGRLGRGFVATLLVAISANLAVFLICTYGLGMTMVLIEPGSGDRQVMGIQSVLGATTASTLAATVLLAILTRYTRDPLRVFYFVAGAVLLLSMIPVAFAPVNTPSTRVVMAILHIVSAGAIVDMLRRWVVMAAPSSVTNGQPPTA